MHPGAPTSSSARLECSFDLASNQRLRVKVRISNSSAVDLFVLNRLWKLNPRSKHMEDPQEVYRFVRRSELRLLWGIAPLPRLETRTYRNIPLAVVLKPRTSIEWNYSTKLPIHEYSAYFPASDARYDATTVKRVVVIVDYVEARAGLTTTPSGLGGAVKVSTPHAVDAHKSVVCSSGPIELQTLRRTDEFSRLDMPNEQPEPIVLPAQ